MGALINSAKITVQYFGVDSENDINRHHRTRKRSRRLDENADNNTTYKLSNFYEQQLNLILDTLINLSKYKFKCGYKNNLSYV